MLLLSFALASALSASSQEAPSPKGDFSPVSLALGDPLERTGSIKTPSFPSLGESGRLGEYPSQEGSENPRVLGLAEIRKMPISLKSPGESELPTLLSEFSPGYFEPFDPPILPCACGCGIFEVGNGSMIPQGPGGLLFFEWDFQDQNRNWNRHSSAPASDNGDRDLRTHFFQIGFQYLFNERWGIEVSAPFAHRDFRRDDGTGTGTIESTSWTDWGDMRIKALYTGLFKDMSLGVDFGLKLPTGNYTQDGADRDTQIGTGSTDLIFGGYYRMPLSADKNWSSFFQVQATIPLFARDQYWPGLEVDASAGINYQGFALGNVAIVPFGQVLLAGRTSDRGANSAQPVASGYQRILLSPGLEFMSHPWMIYGDVEIPVWQNMRGDQLVSKALFKVVVGFSF